MELGMIVSCCVGAVTEPGSSLKSSTLSGWVTAAILLLSDFCLCVCACVCMYVCVGAYRGQKRVLDPWIWDYRLMSHVGSGIKMWLLAAMARSSAGHSPPFHGREGSATTSFLSAIKWIEEPRIGLSHGRISITFLTETSRFSLGKKPYTCILKTPL